MMWGEEQIKGLLSLQKLKTTLSTESANLLPLQGEWKGTKTPGMLLTGRRGQIFTWSPFDNTEGNYNVCVVGRSGSGKSVFMQELLASILGLGGRVFVFDVGRSFEKICFLLKGQFIEFSPHTNLCLNPFTTIPTDNEEVANDALAMLKSVLILMAAPSHGVDDKGAALLEQAMLETWATYKNHATISDIADWLNNHHDPKANDLGQMLYPYTKSGTYGRYFNGPSTVNLNNPLIVIELEELKERKDLQGVVVQMMIINITNQMFLGDRQTPFSIVFDEAWDMLRSKQSGVFIETLARRLRKYRGSLVVGTQSINDFYQSPGAQAAFDNSDWMCMLAQKPESIEQLKKSERLSLSPQKEAQLKSVKTKQGQYAEVMISGPRGYAIGRLPLDPFSLLLYSTKAEDYHAVKQLTQRGIEIEDAINTLLQPVITSNNRNNSQKGKKSMQKLLLSLTVISFWSGITAASKPQGPNPTAEDIQAMMQLSKKLEGKRIKVGVCIRRIAIQMAALLDADAKSSNSTVRETIQALSDRLRQTIEKYERAKNVRVIVYHKDCGAEDVTDDFITTIFPYPVKE